MKKILLLALLPLLICCSGKTVKVYDGKFIPREDGVTLPMADAPGSKSLKWCVDVVFGENELMLLSPDMLAACYVSFLYEIPDSGGQRDVLDVDLDFQDLSGGKYLYSIPYGWLPGKRYSESMKGVTFFYAPADVSLPVIEQKGEDGGMAFSYPDFSGYKFMFQGGEVGQYLSGLLGKLR